MRGRVLVGLLLVVVAALSGCTRAEPVNPNLLAPKLIVDVGVRSGPIVYIHSAFGERSYDRIEVTLDNETRHVVLDAYSLEEKVNTTSAYLEVRVRSGESRFSFRGHFSIDVEAERVHVATLGENGEWSDPRPYGLPFERILEREGSGRP